MAESFFSGSRSLRESGSFALKLRGFMSLSRNKTAAGWIALCMLQPDLYWGPFCEAIGRGDLATDPRFATGPERAAHGAEAMAALDDSAPDGTSRRRISRTTSVSGQYVMPSP